MAGEPRIVEAVGVAVSRKNPISRQVEVAMQQAIEKAVAEGVNDPQEIRKRMLRARDAVKDAAQ